MSDPFTNDSITLLFLSKLLEKYCSCNIPTLTVETEEFLQKLKNQNTKTEKKNSFLNNIV